MNFIRTFITTSVALTVGALFSAAQTPAPAPIRIGIAAPADRMGTDGSSNTAALRELARKYLQGPVIETVTLDAPLPALADAEAKPKGCAYKLIATGGTAAPLDANTLKTKAKQDSEDVITPMVMQVDSEIVKAIVH